MKTKLNSQHATDLVHGIALLAAVLLPIDYVIPVKESPLNLIGDFCLAIFMLLSVGLSKIGGQK